MKLSELLRKARCGRIRLVFLMTLTAVTIPQSARADLTVVRLTTFPKMVSGQTLQHFKYVTFIKGDSQRTDSYWNGTAKLTSIEIFDAKAHMYTVINRYTGTKYVAKWPKYRKTQAMLRQHGVTIRRTNARKKILGYSCVEYIMTVRSAEIVGGTSETSLWVAEKLPSILDDNTGFSASKQPITGMILESESRTSDPKDQLSSMVVQSISRRKLPLSIFSPSLKAGH